MEFTNPNYDRPSTGREPRVLEGLCCVCLSKLPAGSFSVLPHNLILLPYVLILFTFDISRKMCTCFCEDVCSLAGFSLPIPYSFVSFIWPLSICSFPRCLKKKKNCCSVWTERINGAWETMQYIEHSGKITVKGLSYSAKRRPRKGRRASGDVLLRVWGQSPLYISHSLSVTISTQIQMREIYLCAHLCLMPTWEAPH